MFVGDVFVRPSVPPNVVHTLPPMHHSQCAHALCVHTAVAKRENGEFEGKVKKAKRRGRAKKRRSKKEWEKGETQIHFQKTGPMTKGKNLGNRE